MTSLRRDRGFTIAELMVALFVAALLMSATLSLLNDALPRWRLRHAVMDVATSIQATRARAVMERTDATMPFDPARRIYTVTGVGRGASSTRVETASGLVTWYAELPPGVEFVRPDSGETVTLTPPGSGGDGRRGV